MTETLVAVSPPSPKKYQDPIELGGSASGEAFGSSPQAGSERELTPAELAVIKQMVVRAKDAGVALTGPDGLLKALTKTVIETALDEVLSEHLGYDKHAREGRNWGNSRNGTRTRTVLTELRKRGVKDVFFVVCEGLKGLPDSVNAVFPAAIVQTCIIHLIRNTFR